MGTDVGGRNKMGRCLEYSVGVNIGRERVCIQGYLRDAMKT